MNILKLIKPILRKTWRILFVSMAVLGFLIVISLTLFAHFSPPCKRNIVRTIVPLENSSADIVIIDDACSVDTEIVAEDRQTHQRRSLAGFGVMAGDINVAVVDNQIVVTVPTFDGMSRHLDKVGSYPVAFKLQANNGK